MTDYAARPQKARRAPPAWLIYACEKIIEYPSKARGFFLVAAAPTFHSARGGSVYSFVRSLELAGGQRHGAKESQ